jgi:hypothetical protein
VRSISEDEDLTAQPVEAILGQDKESLEEVVDSINSVMNEMRGVIPRDIEAEWDRVARTGDLIAVNEFREGKLAPVLSAHYRMLDNPGLNPWEEIQWKHDVRRGRARKVLAESWVLTNMRAMIVSPATKHSPRSLKAVALATAVTLVLDSNRESGARRNGKNASRSGARVDAERMQVKTAKRGDLVFYHNGKEALRFRDLSDPDKIKRMIDALKEQTMV